MGRLKTFTATAAALLVSALTLLLPVASPAANPFPFASASGSCNNQSKDWSTNTIGAARDRFLVRYVSGGGPTQINVEGTARSVEGPDTAWFIYRDLSAGAPATGFVDCSGTTGAFSVELLDLPDPPTTFSGALTHGTTFGNEVAFRAPGDAHYVADVTVTQGALEVGPFTVASSQQVPLGFLDQGEHVVDLDASDGPQAQWSMTIQALAVILSKLKWSETVIEPGAITQLDYEASGETNLTAVIKDSGGQTVRTLAQGLHINAGSRSLTWDGRSSSGSDLPDDRYTAVLSTQDPSGMSNTASESIVVNRPPDTRFTRKPPRKVRAKRKRAKVRFSFTSNEPDVSFECQFSGGWTPCTSPQTFRLSPGRYKFPVRAKDQFGAVDGSPAEWSFRVKRRR